MNAQEIAIPSLPGPPSTLAPEYPQQDVQKRLTLLHIIASRSGLPEQIQERLPAILVDVHRIPAPPRRTPPEVAVEAEQRDLGVLGLLGDVPDGQHVAEVAPGALREVLQRPVRAALDDDLETDGGRAVCGGVSRDEPDERKGGGECECGKLHILGARDQDQGLTFRRTGS